MKFNVKCPNCGATTLVDAANEESAEGERLVVLDPDDLNVVKTLQCAACSGHFMLHIQLEPSLSIGKVEWAGGATC